MIFVNKRFFVNHKWEEEQEFLPITAAAVKLGSIMFEKRWRMVLKHGEFSLKIVSQPHPLQDSYLFTVDGIEWQEGDDFEISLLRKIAMLGDDRVENNSVEVIPWYDQLNQVFRSNEPNIFNITLIKFIRSQIEQELSLDVNGYDLPPFANAHALDNVWERRAMVPEYKAVADFFGLRLWQVLFYDITDLRKLVKMVEAQSEPRSYATFAKYEPAIKAFE